MEQLMDLKQQEVHIDILIQNEIRQPIQKYGCGIVCAGGGAAILMEG